MVVIITRIINQVNILVTVGITKKKKKKRPKIINLKKVMRVCCSVRGNANGSCWIMNSFFRIPCGLMPLESKYFRLSVQANRKHDNHPNIQFYALNLISAVPVVVVDYGGN